MIGDNVQIHLPVAFCILYDRLRDEAVEEGLILVDNKAS